VTTTFLAALLVQCVMIVLLRHRLGPHWLRRPVSLLVVASVIELGIGPALLAVPAIGANDIDRLGIQPGFINSADLIMSVSMLALTLAYLFTRPERTVTIERPADRSIAAKALDWRLLAVVCIPLTLLTAAGRGYNDGVGDGPDTSLATSLVTTFFVVVVVVTAAAFLMRHGTRWFLLILIIQSVVLAVAGERTPVLIDAAALIVMLLFAGLRVPVPQLAATAVLTVLIVLSISGVRVQQNRNLYYQDSGVSSRVSALAGGLSAAGGSQGGTDAPGLLTQFAIRISSVDFGGAILQAISEGQPRLSPAYVPESLLLAVPSFIWPTKLNREVALDPALSQLNAFGLQDTNFIPGLPGLYIGFLAPTWLIALFGLLGATFGWFERWLLRERTPARLVLLGGAVTVALGLEAGLPGMLVQMRAAVALALVVYVVQVVRGRARPPSSRFSRAALGRAAMPRLTVTQGPRRSDGERARQCR
jgi:hypothetical protein